MQEGLYRKALDLSGIEVLGAFSGVQDIVDKAKPPQWTQKAYHLGISARITRIDFWMCAWGLGDGRAGRDQQCRGVEIGAAGSVDTCAKAGVERLGEKRGRPAPSGTVHRALGGERRGGEDGVSTVRMCGELTISRFSERLCLCV